MNNLLIKPLILGLLVLIGMTSTFTLTEAEYLSPSQQHSSGIPINEIECRNSMILLESPSGKPACVYANSVEKLEMVGFVLIDVIMISESKPTDVSFETITIPSSPLVIPDEDPHEGVIYEPGPHPYCILPSSISVQVPNKVPVGETFDVIITPSFELTPQQLDAHNKYWPDVYSSEELWNNVCREDLRHYNILHPATYEPSSDNVIRNVKTLNDGFFPPYEIHYHLFGELNFNDVPITLQMVINEPLIYRVSDLGDRENLDYLKYDFGVFVITASTTSMYRTVPPVYIYTSIDDGYVTLSEFESTAETTLNPQDLNPDDHFIPYQDHTPNYIMPHINPNITTNSMNSDDRQKMQDSDTTVISEVNLFPNAIRYVWYGMLDTDYEVVISPTNSPHEKFTDYTSRYSYTFVNLEPSTLYDISVSPKDNDSKQSHLQLMTLSSDQISYKTQIVLEVRNTTSGYELSWDDTNHTRSNEYTIERTIDGVVDNVDTITSEPYLFTEQLDPTWSGKTISWKVFEYLGDQKLYSNSISVNIPP